MDNDYILTPDGELVHWGIPGMKWGVRRYQNKDGSLTPAGRKRMKAESDKLKEREQVIKNKERVKARQDKLKAKKAELDARQKALDDAAKAEKAAKKVGKGKSAPPAEQQKSIKDMSDADLQKAVNRARLESELQRLMPQEKPNPKFLTKFIDEAVKPAFISGGKTVLENAIKKIGDNALKDKANPDDTAALKKKIDKLKLEKEYGELTKGKSKTADELYKEEQTRELKMKNDKTEAEMRKAAAINSVNNVLSSSLANSTKPSAESVSSGKEKVDKVLSDSASKDWKYYEAMNSWW